MYVKVTFLEWKLAREAFFVASKFAENCDFGEGKRAKTDFLVKKKKKKKKMDSLQNTILSLNS